MGAPVKSDRPIFLPIRWPHVSLEDADREARSPASGAAKAPTADQGIGSAMRRDYALVLILPNERKDKRVLLIYGIYTQGSQAAIEYLTNPEHMAELHKALLDLAPEPKTIPPYFQLLLTTTVENSVPGKSSLIAIRIISD